MSEDTGAISRPKVRFSQFSGNAQNKEEDVEYCKEKTVLQANGPRIKSIATLKRPIKIVDPKKFTTVCDKDIPQHDCNKEILTRCSEITSENIQSISNKNVLKTETSKILRNTNSIQNIKENCNISTSGKNPQDNILKYPKDNVLKDCKGSTQQKGKENRGTILKKVVSDKDMSKSRRRSSQCIQSVRQTGNCKLSTSSNMQKINTMDSKNSKMAKSHSAPNIIKKTKHQTFKETINTKSVTSNIMPCYKIATKSKVSPVKKTILRNVSGPKIKTFVGPGISHKKKNDVRADDGNKRHDVILDDAAKKLARPEYNSIVCTINKLKELKQQKIRDIDHDLSPAQKSFINGKISAALDFPFDEAIYKNLIDLSIDENQLPLTIIRSKDPEPRHKDIVPKLSDFFVPEYTNEICEAVHIKPRAPKVDENWNAFKISDKILEWKYSMDA